MKNEKMLAASLVAAGLFILTRVGRKQEGGSEESSPLPDPESYEPVRVENVNWTPSSNAYFAYFPGWRRAKAAEVTPEMRQDAAASLTHPLKSIIDRNDYRIVLETHYNDTKGEHKGATIFMKADTQSA
jgi:hypothetical protein